MEKIRQTMRITGTAQVRFVLLILFFSVILFHTPPRADAYLLMEVVPSKIHAHITTPDPFSALLGEPKKPVPSVCWANLLIGRIESCNSTLISQVGNHSSHTQPDLYYVQEVCCALKEYSDCLDLARLFACGEIRDQEQQEYINQTLDYFKAYFQVVNGLAKDEKGICSNEVMAQCPWNITFKWLTFELKLALIVLIVGSLQILLYLVYTCFRFFKAPRVSVDIEMQSKINTTP